MKRAVRVVGLICILVSVGALLPVSSTALFTSEDKGTYILWSQSYTNTYFRQYKDDYSWYDSTNPTSGFNYMGKLSDMRTLFDYGPQDFTDSNYSYLFWGADGVGVWKNKSLDVNQYAYNYMDGQWYHKGNWGDWAKLGSAGLSTAFMGSGTQQTLGNNWKYLFDGTYGYWGNVNMPLGPETILNQFAYDYTFGQWYDHGYWGSWEKLGSPTMNAWFLGDGGDHLLDTYWSELYLGPLGLDYSNWKYVYDGTLGNWINVKLGFLTQFKYDYTYGKWFDQGNWGGFKPLGSSGLSASFMGDGFWHWLDNGNWKYVLGGLYGEWRNAKLDLTQYAYNYENGQWSHRGTSGGWITLPYTGLSSDFLGDAWPHYLSDGWTYRFDFPVNEEIWKYGDNERLKYDCVSGVWYDSSPWNGAVWYQISVAQRSAFFVGDGHPDDVGNGWQYRYNSSEDRAYWKHNAMEPLRYDYATGQWWDYGTEWNMIGNQYISSAFIGDGNWHDMNNAWSYLYQADEGPYGLGSPDTAVWGESPYDRTTTIIPRFAYDYGHHMWLDTSPYNKAVTGYDWLPLNLAIGSPPPTPESARFDWAWASSAWPYPHYGAGPTGYPGGANYWPYSSCAPGMTCPDKIIYGGGYGTGTTRQHYQYVYYYSTGTWIRWAAGEDTVTIATGAPSDIWYILHQ